VKKMNRSINTNMLIAGAALGLFPAFASHAHHPPGGLGVQVVGPVTTMSADTMRRGDLAASFEYDYLAFDTRSDAELRALDADHVHAHDADAIQRGAIGLAWGLNDRLTLGLRVPYIRTVDRRMVEHVHDLPPEQRPVLDLGTAAGLGDISLVGQYALTRGDGVGQGLRTAVLGGIKLPTGETRVFDSRGARLGPHDQPGSGSWDPIVGIVGSLSGARWSVDGNLIYTHATKGAQDTTLGSLVEFRASLSRALRDHDADEGIDWDVTAALELMYEWQGKDEVGGATGHDTGGAYALLGPALRVTSPRGISFYGVFGFEVWEDIRDHAPPPDWRVMLGIGRVL
jgi:hypothetical protein